MNAMLTTTNSTMYKAKVDKPESKQTEEALRESEIRYRRLFETAKDGILLLDAITGEITDVNPFLMALLGYSYKELLGKTLWEIGPFKDIVASQSAFQELRQKKYIRYEELPLETKTGERVEVEFVSNIYKVNGKSVIQCNIRDISERIRNKNSLHKANIELSALVIELQKHDSKMKVINQMNDLLQACKTQKEAYQVVELACSEIFDGKSGGLAILSDSGQYLEASARWGDEPLLKPVFSLEDCWAMRRGKLHEVADLQTSVLCRHFIHLPKTGYLCLPLVVQGETLGLFYLDMPAADKSEHVESWRQLAFTVSEGIKLSLSNLRLREMMQDQATHDPLTGLFNRRYLDNTLPRELSHARRLNAKSCIAMLDLDHLKQFNDTFGHEAGDVLLRNLGHVLQENIRESDIACRFGGDEFVLVMLDSSQEACHQHIEKICGLVRDLQISYGEQILGTMTLSVGIVEVSESEVTADELLGAADKALYAAKHTGRNCIVNFSDLEKIEGETSSRFSKLDY